MKTIASMVAVAWLFVSQSAFAQAPGAQGTPGTAGAGNAAASSPGGGGAPTHQGTGPGMTNPGHINVPPPPEPVSPSLNPNQVPSGGTVQSTTPPSSRPSGTVGSSGTVGQSTRPARLKDPKEDPIVQQSEEEVSRRIKNICKGC